MITATHRRRGGGRIGPGLTALVLSCGLLAGCASVTFEATSFVDPVMLETVEGADGARLTLSSEGAERLRLATAGVTADEAGVRVPYSALIYKADGTTWVYASLEEFVFQREPVTVGAVEGDSVLLTAGPQPGTLVVVIGAAELFGAEFDTAH
jgi:hypothetical protein